MNPANRIRATRSVLLAVILGGLALAVFGIFVGMGVPGLIVSVLGWLAAIVGIVWLVVHLTRRSTSHTGPWRPGDADAV